MSGGCEVVSVPFKIKVGRFCINSVVLVKGANKYEHSLAGTCQKTAKTDGTWDIA